MTASSTLFCRLYCDSTCVSARVLNRSRSACSGLTGAVSGSMISDICSRGLNRITKVQWPQGPDRFEAGSVGCVGKDGGVMDPCSRSGLLKVSPQTSHLHLLRGLRFSLSCGFHTLLWCFSAFFDLSACSLSLPSLCPVCFISFFAKCPLPSDAMLHYNRAGDTFFFISTSIFPDGLALDVLSV